MTKIQCPACLGRGWVFIDLGEVTYCRCCNGARFIFIDPANDLPF
ncbi:hypothetical protein [Methylomonas sp. HYX-M1]